MSRKDVPPLQALQILVCLATASVLLVAGEYTESHPSGASDAAFLMAVVWLLFAAYILLWGMHRRGTLHLGRVTEVVK